jgi:hypothetical protein
MHLSSINTTQKFDFIYNFGNLGWGNSLKLHNNRVYNINYTIINWQLIFIVIQ